MAAIVRSGDLILRGDSGDNHVQVRLDEEGGISIYGMDGTTVNGSADPVQVFETNVVPDDVRVVLGSGKDTILFESFTVGDDVQVKAGSGNDAVGFLDVDVSGTVLVLGGRGSDDFSFDSSTAGDLLHVSMGRGQDTIGVDNAAVGDYASILTGSGADRVALRSSSFDEPFFVTTGSGDDVVSMTEIDTSTAAVITGTGDDTLAVVDSVFSGALFGNGARGNSDTAFVAGSTFEEGVELINFENQITEDDEEFDAFVESTEAGVEATFLDLVRSEARLGTVSEVVLVTPELSDLRAYVELAGLTADLQGGTVSVFAPTDDAFAAVPAETLAALIADPTGILRDLLAYHATAGSVDAEVLADTTSLTSLSGEEITVDNTTNIVLNAEANVLVADIRAKNGFVHTIDAVLNPPIG
jgi:uncharacterized surface protein with fasciclin (FAS1) repeats